ncbi:hypothetical protein D3C73_1394250 [compost metagenome]
MTITGLRPMASESGPVNRRPIASMAVEIDSEILLLAGDTPNSWDSTGRIGCTQYSRANVASPAENRASVTRIKEAVPRFINASGGEIICSSTSLVGAVSTVVVRLT